MKIKCVWEHNGEDTLLYAADFPGAYTRGRSLAEAMGKMPEEIAAFCRWTGEAVPETFEAEVVQEKNGGLRIRDADSDVLFDTERPPMTREEYERGKALAFRSARDLLALYEAVPGRDESVLPQRETFYGPVPRTAREMYEHTKSVNNYYFAELGVDADNEGTILACREKGFALLEAVPGFLEAPPVVGSYGEEWSLRKVLRRFVWHDRIHAKAMTRMALRTFGEGAVPDIFQFFG